MGTEWKHFIMAEKDVGRHVLSRMFKETEAAFWQAEEIDLQQDIADWDTLRSEEKEFIEVVLAFFAASDGLVCENIVESFLLESKIPEAKQFYAMQAAIENIHSEVYSLLIDTLVQEQARKETLFKAIEHYQSIKAKAQWAIKYMDKNMPLGIRLIAFSCVEGVFFCSSFAAIYWMKKRGKMPGLSFSNELIARDESAHRDFAVAYYKTLKSEGHPEMEGITTDMIKRIIIESFELEAQFVKECLPVGMIGMNADMMIQYVQVVADNLLQQFGIPSHFGVSNPFDFMDMINLKGKTNFFEKRVSEYQLAGVKGGTDNTRFSFSQEF